MYLKILFTIKYIFTNKRKIDLKFYKFNSTDYYIHFCI